MTRADLEAQTDELTRLLREAEDRLDDECMGVEAAVRVEDTDTVLRWGKVGSEWALTIDGVDPLQASRRLRILATLHLPQLRKQLKSNVRALYQDLATAIETARTFLRVPNESADETKGNG